MLYLRKQRALNLKRIVALVSDIDRDGRLMIREDGLFFQLNTDGSWKGVSEAGGGGVIRCEKGLWQLGFAARYNTSSPAAAELLAIKDGLLAAWARDIRSLELETDAAELKKMLEDPNSFKDHELGNINRDVASLISRD
uniref:RNase H type-1 domain-containing protein n=1 Tax=Chenopodium quinoa TaxID=63459 RepID=A0A803MSD4_CHEQI